MCVMATEENTFVLRNKGLVDVDCMRYECHIVVVESYIRSLGSRA